MAHVVLLKRWTLEVSSGPHQNQKGLILRGFGVCIPGGYVEIFRCTHVVLLPSFWLAHRSATQKAGN